MSDWKKQWASTIQDGVINQAISKYHAERPDRAQDCATPSTLTDCPRLVWFKYKKKVKPVIQLGWGKSQRNMLGRQLESLIAEQLRESGNLLHHWKDDDITKSIKFEMGVSETRICGTPDLLLKLSDDQIAISDAKTSMGKSFGYVPLTPEEAFKDFFWFKYKLQVEAYYILCHKNEEWFKDEELPLPAVCHLFSYALDDGVNRREFTWKPTRKSTEQVLKYALRWNRAFASETMPGCTCDEFDGAQRKFCYYVQQQETTKTGAKIGIKCCGRELYETV